MLPRRINDQTLLEFASGQLDATAHTMVEAAVAADPELAATVRRYQTTAVTVANDDAVEPPVDVVSRAKAIFAAPVGQPVATFMSTAKAVLARLIFDSRVQPATVRSAALNQPVQLSFETDDVAFDLQATRTGNNPDSPWRVIGQFAIDEHDNDVPVNIRNTNGTVAAELTVTCDEPFTVELSPGQYVIHATFDESIVTFPNIDLQ